MTVKSMQRTLGLPAVIAVSISAMLGSGIFVLPGIAAAKTGPSLWLAYLLAGLLVLPAAISKSELATAMPVSGGTYVYLDRAFGPLAGTVAGLGLWLSLLLKSAFALVGMVAYLSVLAEVPLNTVAILVTTAIVLVNIRGIRGVGQVQIVLVIIAIAVLATLAVAGATRFDTGLMRPMFPDGIGGLLAATGLVFVSYDGVTKVAAIAEEVKKPARNLPAGIILSLAVVSAVYMAVTLVLAGNIPQAELQGDLRSIFTLAERWGGLRIGVPVAVVGALTMASMANAGLLAASRFPFAMSRDNLLPPSLGYLHPQSLTPVAAVVASGLLMAATVVLLDVERIAKLASSFVILIFMVESVTVVLLRESRVQWYKPAFRSPLYPWVQIVGVAGGAILLAVLGSVVVAGIASVMLPGVVLWLLYGRHRTERRGVISQRGPRQELLRENTDPAGGQAVSGRAPVLVPLFGRERAPEMLVELASALAEDGRTQVVHLTEIPEQTALEVGMAAEDARIDSLARRIAALGEAKSSYVTFNAMVSRDIVQTVHQLSLDLESDWLVIEWEGRTTGLFTVGNPLGWLAGHVSCNLATFSDAGVRYIRKVLVIIEPGPHDALVVNTADHLATVHQAELTFARFVHDDDDTPELQGAADYLDQVRELSEAPSTTMLIRGRDNARAIGRAAAAFDLMVIGEEPPTLWRRFFETELDRITAWAPCSVLRVQTPRGQTHASLTDHDQAFRLCDHVDPSCVEARVDVAKKEALFNHFGTILGGALEDITAEQIVEALWARERMQNTSVGDGLALPHATIDTARKSLLGVFTVEKPLAYQAPDGHPVDIFFVTLGPPMERNTHLLLLANIAKMVLETDILARLRDAESGADIIRILDERCP